MTCADDPHKSRPEKNKLCVDWFVGCNKELNSTGAAQTLH